MTHDNRPTHLDLFSGIGGFSIAFEAAGFRTVWFSEIEPYPSAVLKRHWPEVPNFGDVRNVTKDSVGNVDVITGGFPCQPFSVAGERRGDSDERFLWPELVRILREIRPGYALFENVPGLLTIDGGRTFNRILSDISSLGYDCLWNCVPACAVGANHERDRVWIFLAHPNSNGRKARALHGWQGEGLEYFAKGEGEDLPDADRPGLQESNNAKVANRAALDSRRLSSGWNNWAAEPYVDRVADGIPHRVDRLKSLGNAIVPQVAFIFAQAIHKQLRP